jgi:hypothetical protein
MNNSPITFISSGSTLNLNADGVGCKNKPKSPAANDNHYSVDNYNKKCRDKQVKDLTKVNKMLSDSNYKYSHEIDTIIEETSKYINNM